eukprot:CAMPEP_0172447788 /NCGR_PEP_ID=MMETSP1065-20121228/7000_1 /TAXON_ID=265537 /ORGANISM="Amphiprora paludosa, Strain CCMP125" /LENGTH=91 /DNA_ID=CAMNT_0013199159 /DNA_START=1519 /DNA_END=1795 /DNA_ORIENTATION=-
MSPEFSIDALQPWAGDVTRDGRMGMEEDSYGDYSGITAPGNSDRVILGTTRTPTTLWRNASTRESSTKVEKNQLDFTIEAIYPFPIKSNRG